MTRKENKILRQLPTTFERYATVFSSLGLPIRLDDELRALPVRDDVDVTFLSLRQQGYRIIGIAPFAQHPQKMYPVEKMKELIRLIAAGGNAKIFLFGGGKQEAETLQQWQQELPGIVSLAGKMDLQSELQHIAQLDLMISMDSANMHLASLFGVPVVSIWGGTHPFAGFYGWRQPLENAVQIELYCRPCSVFGNKTCYRGDWACLHELPPEKILQQVNRVLER